jgi:small subunit ribosomal protein S17
MAGGKPEGRRKTRVGYVVSDKMDKTVVVAIDKKVKHPVFKKFVKRRTKYKAHDEDNACQVGDKVLIEETRPLSKGKCWRVKETLRKAVSAT